MVPNSPADALGSHAPVVRDVVVEVARSRHDRSAEAHHVAATRYSMAFGSQWRDLLDDTDEALRRRGFQSYKLTPAAYKLPVINDCLVYVWRVPDTVDAVSRFASSPTRKNGFATSLPDPMLFEPSFLDAVQPVDNVSEEADFERVVRAVGDTMPVVLVMVHSSPRQLRSIEWAIAVLDGDEVKLHGQERIWEPEIRVDDAASEVESFDSGTPIAIAVGVKKQDRPQTNA